MFTFLRKPDPASCLNRSATKTPPIIYPGQPAALRLSPYAWSNRDLSSMQVWIPVKST